MKKRNLMAVAGAASVLAVTATAAFVITTANTTVTSTEGLRDKEYTSIQELYADSALVVVVSVAESGNTVIEGGAVSGPPYTVSTVTVSEVVASSSSASVPDELDVFQLGSPESLFGGAKVLESGETYLLFLVPTEMPGADENDYVPTGTFSGIFSAAENGIFSNNSLEGDALPASFTRDQLASLVQ